ncbi:MAG: NAD(P)/FAD-dependent oxidoreductase [Pirellulales bacterium]|nr:NAD(P)/FAD-dependent oxidoreductase [Pirellulales bacterium]
MQSCDVLIVGGGPAGSTCAWRLGQAGLAVIVLDKAVFPRHKVCAGWITPAVIEELDLDVEDYRRSRVFQPITSFRTGCLGGPQVVTTYDRAVSYGIRRCEFDDYLLRRSGAALELSQPLDTIERAGGRWVVNGRFQTSLVVGAGGHFCPVARLLGEEKNSTEIVLAAQEIEFEMDPQQQAQCRAVAETPEIYFCEDLEGYGWCIRKGNYLNIGLGRLDRRRISAHVADFCCFLQERGRIPQGLSEKFRGHAYLDYDHSSRRLLDDGMLLIGDAAGLAYPQSGEGIRPAIESGLMAAEVVVQCRGDYRRQRLEAYRELLHERFGRRGSDSSRRHWPLAGLKRRIGRCLLANRSFVRHIVLDRWFLHRHQTPWKPSSFDRFRASGPIR